MKRKLSALLSIILCLAMCLGTFAWADEASPSPSASPAPDSGSAANGPEEVIYARLDASGDPQDAYAIVALTLDEEGTVEHYGRYTAVSNLTDTSPIEYRGGVVSLTAPAGRYYYQGTLRSAKMPWDIDITYTLDGQEIEPGELGGKSGDLEVSIHTATNSGFDPYFTENYMLQISVTLDAELCEDITSRNGTVANAGSDKQITFVVLPGGEGDIGFSAKVHDFTMGGFTIAAVPYSMDSLMDMGEISTITSGIEQLSSAITQLTGGASTINDGAATLGENGPTLTDASDQIESALKQIADGLQGYDLSSMTDGLDQLAELPAGLSTIAAYMAEMGSGLTQLSTGYKGVASGLHEAVEKINAILPSLPGGGGDTGDGGDEGGDVEEGGGDTGGIDMALVGKIISGLDSMMLEAYAAGYSDCYNAVVKENPNTTIPSISPSAPNSYASEITELLMGIVSGSGTGTSGSGNGGDTGSGVGYMDAINELINGLTTAANTLDMLNGKLDEVSAGMIQMSDQMMSIAIQISSGLEDMTDFDTSAITELQTGMTELAVNYEQFNDGLKAYTDGVSQLSEGMDTYTSGMYALNSQTQGIPDLLDEFLGTGDDDAESEDGESSDGSSEVVSFLDDRNTDTASVQFVISTDGISAPEEPVEDQPAEEPQGFFAQLWDKIVSLFT